MKIHKSRNRQRGLGVFGMWEGESGGGDVELIAE